MTSRCVLFSKHLPSFLGDIVGTSRSVVEFVVANIVNPRVHHSLAPIASFEPGVSGPDYMVTYTLGMEAFRPFFNTQRPLLKDSWNGLTIISSSSRRLNHIYRNIYVYEWK